MRLIICKSNQPPLKPSKIPKPNWRIKLVRKSKLKLVSPAASMAIKVTVRNIAIGSLLPDSISRVEPTRSFRALPLSRLNTAAASVEPTIEPINSPSSKLRSNNHAAAQPVKPAVTATPKVASDSAGHSATRKVATRVRIPPSSKITASARLLTK